MAAHPSRMCNTIRTIPRCTECNNEYCDYSLELLNRGFDSMGQFGSEISKIVHRRSRLSKKRKSNSWKKRKQGKLSCGKIPKKMRRGRSGRNKGKVKCCPFCSPQICKRMYFQCETGRICRDWKGKLGRGEMFCDAQVHDRSRRVGREKQHEDEDDDEEEKETEDDGREDQETKAEEGNGKEEELKEDALVDEDFVLVRCENSPFALRGQYRARVRRGDAHAVGGEVPVVECEWQDDGEWEHGRDYVLVGCGECRQKLR